MNSRLNGILDLYRAWSRSVSELWHEPIKVILHPSEWRIRWLGFFILIGNPLFFCVWTEIIVQPYEHLPTRLFLSLLGLLVLLETKKIISGDFFWKWFCFAVLFIQLPLFFIYMAYRNGFDPVWLGSCVAMVLIYYQTIDWRLATLSIFASLLILLSVHIIHPFVVLANYQTILFVIVFIFSWFSAIILGGSAANLSKIATLNTAFNLGVMAHELRTPISSIGLLSTILKNKHAESQDPALFHLSSKLDVLVKTINNHIDNQIINSKMIDIKSTNEVISIEPMMTGVLDLFPYKNALEKAAIRLVCMDNFQFNGSSTLFTQVFNNLIRNAFKALAAKELSDELKRIDITTYISNNAFGKQIACIDITDNGVGIQADHIRKVLEPFFSTNDALGHGLGLSFCKKVVQASKGDLTIQSSYGHSTTITIELPLSTPPFSTPQ